jgi:hypothetical protein
VPASVPASLGHRSGQTRFSVKRKKRATEVQGCCSIHSVCVCVGGCVHMERGATWKMSQRTTISTRTRTRTSPHIRTWNPRISRTMFIGLVRSPVSVEPPPTRTADLCPQAADNPTRNGNSTQLGPVATAATTKHEHGTAGTVRPWPWHGLNERARPIGRGHSVV